MCWDWSHTGRSPPSKNLPYKTELVSGHPDVGASGMRVFAVLWLLAGIGFAAGAVGLVRTSGWWAPTVVLATMLSLTLTVLDWRAAQTGAVVDILILVALIAGRGVLGATV